MTSEATRAMYDHRLAALNDVDAELARLIDYANEKIYDDEGELHHEWTDCDAIRWSKVLNTLEDARTGIYSIKLNIGGR